MTIDTNQIRTLRDSTEPHSRSLLAAYLANHATEIADELDALRADNQRLKLNSEILADLLLTPPTEAELSAIDAEETPND